MVARARVVWCAALGLVATTFAPAAVGAAPAIPGQLAALGDSISAGWGSRTNGAGENIPGVNVADSWGTGDAPEIGSHYERLSAVLPTGATLTAVNLAQPGASIADPNYGMVAQSREVPGGTGYVLFGGGTADVCGPDDVSSLLTPDEFRRAFRAGLTTLRARLPGVRVFVVSIPNWYELWQNQTLRDRPRPGYACPLLFGVNASEATAATVERAIRDYNSILAEVCTGAEFGGICDFDGGAAYRLRLGGGDLSSVDWFHFSAQGQARLAAATWDAGPFDTRPARANIPAEHAATTKPAPAMPAVRPPAVPAPAPHDRGDSGGIALVAAAVAVDRPAIVQVIVVDRHTHGRLLLLKGSSVGESITVNRHTAIYDHAKGKIAIRLRIAARALKGPLAIRITAHARGRQSVLSIPFRA
jgi:lysophospholipase L1-like esterase